MRVVIFAGFFWPAYKAGGPARSLTNLATELAVGNDVLVVAADRDLGDEKPFPHLRSPAEYKGATVWYVNVRSLRQLARTYRGLRRQYFDVAILNSIWDVPLSFIPAVLLWARRISADTVVLMPRGELEGGALALKSGKKKAATHVVRCVYAHAADVIAATSESELSNTRTWFPELDQILVSNLPDTFGAGYVADEGGAFRVLYLGRIHPTKGLLELLGALHALDGTIRVTVAGPVGDDDYFRQCHERSLTLPDNVQVDWVGPVGRDQLEQLLWNSDLMATLTLGENFGHTIAEALQAGCPVLATDKTPWTGILREGAGYVCTDRSDLAAVARLVDAARLDAAAGRTLARQQARQGFERWFQCQPFDVVEAALAAVAGRDAQWIADP